MIEAWCIAHQDDVPVTPDRRCPEHGGLAIPPSWSNQHAAYPWPERPDGWSWQPPAEIETKAAPALLMATCAHCRKAFTYRPRGRVVPTYCPGQCKNRAAAARKRDKQRLAGSGQREGVAA